MNCIRSLCQGNSLEWDDVWLPFTSFTLAQLVDFFWSFLKHFLHFTFIRILPVLSTFHLENKSLILIISWNKKGRGSRDVVLLANTVAFICWGPTHKNRRGRCGPTWETSFYILNNPFMSSGFYLTEVRMSLCKWCNLPELLDSGTAGLLEPKLPAPGLPEPSLSPAWTWAPAVQTARPAVSAAGCAGLASPAPGPATFEHDDGCQPDH